MCYFERNAIMRWDIYYLNHILTIKSYFKTGKSKLFFFWEWSIHSFFYKVCFKRNTFENQKKLAEANSQVPYLPCYYKGNDFWFQQIAQELSHFQPDSVRELVEVEFELKATNDSCFNRIHSQFQITGECCISSPCKTSMAYGFP